MFIESRLRNTIQLCTHNKRRNQQQKLGHTCTLGCPKKIGNYKMILILIFLFHQPYVPAMPKKPKPKNTLCACADFLYRTQPIRNATEKYFFFAKDISRDFVRGKKHFNKIQ